MKKIQITEVKTVIKLKTHPKKAPDYDLITGSPSGTFTKRPQEPSGTITKRPQSDNTNI